MLKNVMKLLLLTTEEKFGTLHQILRFNHLLMIIVFR